MEKDKTNKKGIGGSISSESQLQWDKLEKEHGSRSVRDRWYLCSSCHCSLPNSMCSKKHSIVHPIPQKNSDVLNSRSIDSSNKNTNQVCEEDNNPKITERLDFQKDKPSINSVVNRNETYAVNLLASASSNGDNAQNMATSSIPKLPSIAIMSTDALQAPEIQDKLSSPNTTNDFISPDCRDDSVSRKKLEFCCRIS